MEREAWNSSKTVGSASFMFKEKLKCVKNRIKVWREQNSSVGAKEVRRQMS